MDETNRQYHIVLGLLEASDFNLPPDTFDELAIAGVVGFAPIFEDLEKAMSQFPEAQVISVEEHAAIQS